MILSFKKQFEQPILDGTKIHTIREDSGDRWYPGRKIQMATGVRTKKYHCFKEAECIEVQEVYMTNFSRFEVSINEKFLYHNELLALAKNDGFGSVEEMEAWFFPYLEQNSKKVFFGKIIHWTMLTY